MTVLLAVVLAATVAFATGAPTPALAQVTGGDPPDYVLEEDGTVVVDGDIVMDCPTFAYSLEQGRGLVGNLERARAVLEQCEEVGLLSPGGAASASASVGEPTSASVGEPTSDPANAPPSAGTSAHDEESGELPGTGGPALPALLVVSSVVVVASGLLMRKVAG